MQENNNHQMLYYNVTDELDEDLNINLEKIVRTIWSRRVLIVKVFTSILAFFILLTFIMPKKYQVTADLYINKANNSNMLEVNPYVLDEAGSPMVSMGADKAMNNEIELMKSDLVLDRVIRDNNIKYKKGKRKGEYTSAKDFYKKGKKLKLENTKNTNVITIKYTAGKPELAYGVVSSLITNYIELHKELNSEKSKSDKKIIEKEYAKAKEKLSSKLNQSNGLPAQSMNGMGNLSAMSAFSTSASNAMSSIKSQFLEGQKSQLAVSEEQEKVAQLATKLEWASMVEEMSDSSKVLILSEPLLPRPFEKKSPKLLINIILGCLVGGIASLTALIYAEITDKKLCYSKLSDNVIYDINKEFNQLKASIISNESKKILLISFLQIPQDLQTQLNNFSNITITYAELSFELMQKIKNADKIFFVSRLGYTSSESYNIIRKIIKDKDKELLQDILI